MVKFGRIACIAACFFVIVCAVMIFFGRGGDNINTDADSLLRLHIRADSNDESDQRVKLAVRDAVTAYLEGELDGVSSRGEALKKLRSRLGKLNDIAEETLSARGFGYGARTKLTNEYFPARAYGDVVLPQGYYDALVIELGSGAGDNWWCVIYPPLCFVKAEAGDDFKYRSLIKELWDKYVGKKDKATEEKQCLKVKTNVRTCELSRPSFA